MTKHIRIGCYSAFYGDSPDAAAQLVELEGAKLDYLVADYLAEITMGVLAMRRNARHMRGGKDILTGEEGADYIDQFPKLVLNRLLPQLINNGTKVVTNAGALDPLGCKRAIEKLLQDKKIEGIKVAAVYGDDLMGDQPMTTLDTFEKDIVSFSPLSVTELEKDADRMPTQGETIVSMNGYLGAQGIAAALKDGAQIIVTGRVVDSAIVVGPLLHEFGWKPTMSNYYDLLGSASLAGHIIECGCHATGGNFTDWKLAAFSEHGGYSNMGYPIVEFEANGEFIVTKPEKTGGLVSVGTVSEQILYETLDPALYIMADVIVDMRQTQLTQVGKDRVHVKGTRGYQPTPYVKCCGIFMDGWQVSGELIIGGHEAKQKAIAVGNAVIERVRRFLKQRGLDDFRQWNVEPLGGESLYGPNATTHETRETVLRISAMHSDPKALKILANEIMAPVTCMAPGTGFGMPPVPLPSLVHFPCLLPKEKIQTRYLVSGEQEKTVEWTPWDTTQAYTKPPPVAPIAPAAVSTPLIKTKLLNLAYGRSGDKGDVSNIGIIARDPRYMPYIKRSVTEQVMHDAMKHLCHGSVKCYDLPGLNALNFVLTQSLGGGGLSSLIMDRQGKSFAQIAISLIDVEIPAELLPSQQAKI